MLHQVQTACAMRSRQKTVIQPIKFTDSQQTTVNLYQWLILCNGSANQITAFALVYQQNSTNMDYQNFTSILMKMLQSDWLSYSYTISHQSTVGRRSSTKCDIFVVFQKFWKDFRCKRVTKFPRRLREAHLRFLEFKNLKILKNRVRA